MSAESPGETLQGFPLGDLDAELDAAFDSLENAAGPPCDVSIVIGGLRVFLVKSCRPRE